MDKEAARKQVRRLIHEFLATEDGLDLALNGRNSGEQAAIPDEEAQEALDQLVDNVIAAVLVSQP